MWREIMIVKAKFIEIVWDNYQGGSGTPIVRETLIDIPDETAISMVESKVVDILSSKGIKGTLHNNEKSYPYDRLIKVEMMPVLHAS